MNRARLGGDAEQPGCRAPLLPIVARRLLGSIVAGVYWARLWPGVYWARCTVFSVRHDEVGVAVLVRVAVAERQVAGRLRFEQVFEIACIFGIEKAERSGAGKLAVGVLRITGSLGVTRRDASRV